MSSSHAAANRFNMRCAVCGQQRNRKGWFKPQWEAEKPVVHHYSGDYDRCKECYYNLHAMPPAPPTNEDQRTGATATALCMQMRLQAKRCGTALEKFMERWIFDGMHNEPVRTSPGVEYYRDYGTVDCELMTDPKQVEYAGRWTFDPRNCNYAKAFHMAWPQLASNMNSNTLGNIIESLLGVRNAAAKYHAQLEAHRAIDSVCKNASKYVNSVYQFTQATDSEYAEIGAWCAYVRDLASATAGGDSGCDDA